MKKIENLLHSKGYVSIETLIVAGLIIASGAFLVSKLAWKGKDISVSTNNTMDKVQQMQTDNSYTGGSTTPGGDTSNPNTPDKPSVPEIDIKNLEYKETNDGVIITKYIKPTKDFAVQPVLNGNKYDYTISGEDIVKGGIKEFVFYTNKPTLKVGWQNLNGQKINDNLYKYTLNGRYMCIGSSEGDLYMSVNDYWRIGLYNGAYDDTLTLSIPKEDFVNKDMTVNRYEEDLNIKIPDTINGKPVIGIGDNAFSRKYIDKVILPKNLQFVGTDAFSENLLTEIELPNTLKTIGKDAFAHNLLSKIDIPNGVETIEAFAFFSNNLKEVIIPNSVKKIANSYDYARVFGNRNFNDNITNVTMPSRFKANKDEYFNNASDIKFNLI